MGSQQSGEIGSTWVVLEGMSSEGGVLEGMISFSGAGGEGEAPIKGLGHDLGIDLTTGV